MRRGGSKSLGLMIGMLFVFLAAAFIPWLEGPGQSGAETDQASSSFVASALGDVCDDVPSGMEEMYVHPFTSIGAVSIVAALLMLATAARDRCCRSRLSSNFAFDHTKDKMVQTAAIVRDPHGSESRSQRSFYLTLHLFIGMFLIGEYYIKGPSVQGSWLCRHACPFIMVPVYKPGVPTFWYLVTRVLDTPMSLHNNVWTMTLCFIASSLVLMWFVAACMLTAPLVFLCFFFVGWIIVLPAIWFFLRNWLVLGFGQPKSSILLVLIQCCRPKRRRRDGMSGEERHKEVAQDIVDRSVVWPVAMRLVSGCMAVAFMSGGHLLSFYQGSEYGVVLQHAWQSIVKGFAFWTPEWSLTFSWPAALSFPEKFALGMSLGLLGSEYALETYNVIYFRMIHFGHGLLQADRRDDQQLGERGKATPIGKSEAESDNAEE